MLTIDNRRKHMAKPIDKFDSTITRCLMLIALHRSLEKARNKGMNLPASIEELCDLSRAAIVLAVSGMDAYFTSKFTELLVPFLKKKGPTPDLVSFLDKAGLNTEAALEMLTMNRPYRRIRTLVDAHLDRITTQQASVIDELFQAYGIKGFTKHAIAMTKRKTLWPRIEKLVARRHEIVHESDLNCYGRMQSVDAKLLTRQLADLSLFIHSCDHLANRIGK